jgi:hypothetical protein
MSDNAALTVAQLLPDHFDRIGEIVDREFHEDEKSKRLGIPAFVWKGLDAPVSAAIHGALERDVLELLAEGWRSAHELRQLAAKNKGEPDARVEWTLGTHSLTTRVHPLLQISVPGHRFPALRFTLELSAEIALAQLSIQGGRITAANALQRKLVAQLRYGEVKLHEPRKSRAFEPLGRHVFAAPGLEIPLPK